MSGGGSKLNKLSISIAVVVNPGKKPNSIFHMSLVRYKNADCIKFFKRASGVITVYLSITNFFQKASLIARNGS